MCRRAKFRLRKKNMNLCGYESEEREHGVGTGVDAAVPSETLRCNLKCMTWVSWSELVLVMRYVFTGRY